MIFAINILLIIRIMYLLVNSEIIKIEIILNTIFVEYLVH